MSHPDVRYKQRLANYCKAVEMVRQVSDLYHSRPLSQIEKQGAIKSFEFTFELAWKLMKDYLIYQGNPEIMGPRDAIRQAFSLGLITDGQTWMAMIENRNLTSHTYDEETMEEILIRIINEFFPLFLSFKEKMMNIAERN